MECCNYCQVSARQVNEIAKTETLTLKYYLIIAKLSKFVKAKYIYWNGFFCNMISTLTIVLFVTLNTF